MPTAYVRPVSRKPLPRPSKRRDGAKAEVAAAPASVKRSLKGKPDPLAEPAALAIVDAVEQTAAVATAAAPAPLVNGFEALGITPELARVVAALGYETPTAIQERAIPALLAGRDLLGQAQTGTGKTAAFALPLLQQLDPKVRGVQAIVLTPTRELALQVTDAVEGYGRAQGVRVLAVYGGQPIGAQCYALQRGVQVVIGTPGRVKDHLERGTLALDQVRFFGLDEADEMLKMGFIEDVEWILEHAPKERQIALFSATLPGPVRRIAERTMRDPVDVQIEQKTRTVAAIEQYQLRAPWRDKADLLERVLASEGESDEATLVFVATQRMTEELTERLQANGFEAECIHGGMGQPQREAVVRRLRARRTRVVLATDVAARGLDVDHIGLVINFDMPRDREVYVHRIGRTGRAGRAGRALSFWQPREGSMMESLERYTGQPMRPYRIPSAQELHVRRRERFAADLEAVDAAASEPFAPLVAKLVAEGMDPAEVAARALRLAWGAGRVV